MRVVSVRSCSPTRCCLLPGPLDRNLRRASPFTSPLALARGFLTRSAPVLQTGTVREPFAMSQVHTSGPGLVWHDLRLASARGSELAQEQVYYISAQEARGSYNHP